MKFSEYMQLRERAEAAGIGDDKSLAQLLHYLQFQEIATRNFQAYMNEMGAWCRNIVKDAESRIKEAENNELRNRRTIDRDELLKVAEECEEADVDGVVDWAERIRKAVGE